MDYTSFFFEIDNIKPTRNAHDNIDEPPYEINGKVIPFVGIKLRVERKLIKNCEKKIIAKPERDKKSNIFELLKEW